MKKMITREDWEKEIAKKIEKTRSKAKNTQLSDWDIITLIKAKKKAEEEEEGRKNEI